MNVLRRSLLSLVLAAPAMAVAQEPEFYNEVFAADGSVRPQYKEAYETYRRMNKRDRQFFIDASRGSFLGDNALNPIPRILTESELKLLKEEVQNRGTAIRMLLEEYYSGGNSFEKFISREEIEGIVKRNGESRWAKAFRKSAVGQKALKKGAKSPFPIRFNYGPDIIRGPDGHFYVLEDNPGYIGGIGDLKKARETQLKWAPGYKNVPTVNDPDKYYRDLAALYAEQSRKGRKIVAYQIPPYPDNEDLRIKELHKKVGIVTVTPGSKQKLVVGKNNVFLETPQPDGSVLREKVGFVFLNGEHSDLDSAHPLNYEKAMIFEAEGHLEEKDLPPKVRKRIEAALVRDGKGRIDTKELRKALDKSTYRVDVDANIQKQVEGLTQAILDGKVSTNYTPGIDFIGDKEFNMIVDDAYVHYLKKKPRLRNVETFSMAKKDKKGRWIIDEEKLAKVMQDPNRYVLKTKDGRGGDGVWVGKKIPHEEFRAVEARIRKNPTNFIAQRYMALSQMEGFLTDLRMIAYVHENGVYVSDTPWARSIPASGNGKVNLSDHGLEATVMVVKDPPPTAASPKLPVVEGRPDKKKKKTGRLGVGTFSCGEEICDIIEAQAGGCRIW